MKYDVVDLHLHSHYAYATSKDLTLEGLYYWGKMKGVTIIGTGDFTHPAWFSELSEKLVQSQGGFYTLKDDISRGIDASLPQSVRENPCLFVPTVEISSIYSRHDKTRKVHSCIVVPSLEKAGELNAKFSKIGNLAADGRPTLGLDTRDLFEIVLNLHEDTLFFPAHIWTPWFGIFGSKSGFDSLEEAFGDLRSEVYAIETGLSSDPYMNWRVEDLEPVTILSNSDAHSPQKIGREATVIATDLNYKTMVHAIKTNNGRLRGTIEFFPEEGKYHFDGHRKCAVRLSPKQTEEHGGICPVCHTRVTVGVENRVDSLAARPDSYKPSHKQIEYIVPLSEILAEIEGVGVNTKTVKRMYQEIIMALGSEFELLRSVPVSEIESAGFYKLSVLVERMRKKDLIIEPGYDGEYGTVRFFQSTKERESLGEQANLL
ncbi:DNA helicase UvrD [Candidatus Roizmanbacteria bacterium]|nr:MAG: DNA helicase UvrD [Candidatus Roizmanbacteria bacterium]